MAKYVVTGTVPQPMYDPQRSVFDHDQSTQSNSKKRVPNGTAYGAPITEPRKVKVTTSSPVIADEIAASFKSKGRTGEPLFEDVTVEEIVEVAK